MRYVYNELPKVRGKSLVEICRDPSHKFPSMLYIPPGFSKTHKCPGCGQETMVKSPIVYL